MDNIDVPCSGEDPGEENASSGEVAGVETVDVLFKQLDDLMDETPGSDTTYREAQLACDKLESLLVEGNNMQSLASGTEWGDNIWGASGGGLDVIDQEDLDHQVTVHLAETAKRDQELESLRRQVKELTAEVARLKGNTRALLVNKMHTTLPV